MRLDYALRTDKPPEPITESDATAKALYEKWEESNRLCLIVMKYTMDKTIKKSVPSKENAKDFLTAVNTKFTKFDKAEKGTYLEWFSYTRYDGTIGVRDHIMKMTNYAATLGEMEVKIYDSFLVWKIMQSLPSSFDTLKTSYNAQKLE
ncbi:uncharacterized protein LOC122066372 [Macadamia integrifolia]|uniref:uncharacterized protein LOC122066372 n=1 Tax=Macadamia integrifolia TaxID=60698 RepID=UPI001C4EB231|nr:uncharacterized protein LOC122066372 [Macadamia integrifolia]